VQGQLIDHFGLRENAFGVTPDPRFLFLSHTHREALAALVNGIHCDFGFQLLVAQPGMGKTTLLFNFLEQFHSTSHTAFLFQSQSNPCDLLQSVLLELGTSSEETSIRKLSEQLNQVLVRSARERKRVIVVLDEAQNLDFAVLESLRQLSNFETTTSKLMQVVLAGQPQLAKRLGLPEQEQLRQRISSIGRLSPLTVDETHAYIDHRLSTAGYKGVGLFSEGAVRNIWDHSRGVPRTINTLCFNAMLLGFAENAKSIDELIVKEAVRDLDLDTLLTDLYQTQPTVSSPDNGKLQPNREAKPRELDNSRKGVIGEPDTGSGVPARNAGTIASGHNGNGGSSGPGENVLPAPVEARAVSKPGLEEHKISLQGKSVPPAELAPVASAPKPDPAVSTLLGKNGKVAIESNQSSTKALRSHTVTPSKNSTVFPVTGNAKIRVQDPLPKLVETTVAQKDKASGSPRPQPKTGVVRRDSKNHVWAKIVSLTAIIAIAGALALVLVGKFPSQDRVQAETDVGGLPGLIRSKSGQSAPTSGVDSTLDAPNPPAKSRPANSNASRNTDSNEFDEVIVRKFPRDSNIAAATPGNSQQLETIFFEQDSSEIDSGYRSSLQRIADALAENPDVSAILEGHTDSIGPEAYNRNLSSRRAIAVRDALVNDLHVSTSRLTAIGAGSESPVQPNSSAAGRAHNRRVEVRLVLLGQ
jgi:type II secretory pathway predicted ATPase ExeA/outer membrane protein OmpA-like peptidoglycan-associated protein